MLVRTTRELETTRGMAFLSEGDLSIVGYLLQIFSGRLWFGEDSFPRVKKERHRFFGLPSNRRFSVMTYVTYLIPFLLWGYRARIGYARSVS